MSFSMPPKRSTSIIRPRPITTGIQFNNINYDGIMSREIMGQINAKI